MYFNQQYCTDQEEKTVCILNNHTQDKTNETEIASQSLWYASALQERIDVHISRLDNLMTANNLKRIATASDGNCFFESVSHQVSMTGEQIRERECAHLDTEFAEYIQFVQAEADDDDNSLYLKYFFNVGVWNDDVGDILPLAVENIFF